MTASEGSLHKGKDSLVKEREGHMKKLVALKKRLNDVGNEALKSVFKAF